MIDMSNDSGLFRTREQLEADGWRLGGNVFRKEEDGRLREHLPLYEAKMVHQFDHRWATYDGGKTRDLTLAEKQDPNRVVLPRYWVDAREVYLRTADLPKGLLDALRAGNVEFGADYASIVEEFALPPHDGDGDPADVDEYLKRCSPRWLMGWRDITNSTNERTLVGGVFPMSAVGNNLPLWMPSVDDAELLSSVLSSLVCDFVARLKVGGTHLNFFIAEQIAVLSPATFQQPSSCWGTDTTIREWLRPRNLELAYTAWDLQPFAQDCGRDGPPFRWDEERRFLIRAELDAAFFHLYLPSTPDGRWAPARGDARGAPATETAEELAALTAHFPTPRDAVEYVLGTFPIVRRNDEQRHGEYRTKRVILDVYDALQEARVSGRPYRTRLDPPPGDARCRHPPREAAP